MAAGCRIATQYNVAGVCIKPYAVALAADVLKGSQVRVGVTIGFPHGSSATAVKVAEADRACAERAEELDMVVNVGKVLSSDWPYVGREIKEVVNCGHAHKALVKVIFENCHLRDEHKIRLCEICGQAGADFVKTSTGFGEGGATIEDVKLMRKHSPPKVLIKAAGGIRTFEKLLEFKAAGASRIGASATAAILDECKRQLGIT